MERHEIVGKLCSDKGSGIVARPPFENWRIRTNMSIPSDSSSVEHSADNRGNDDTRILLPPRFKDAP